MSQNSQARWLALLGVILMATGQDYLGILIFFIGCLMADPNQPD